MGLLIHIFVSKTEPHGCGSVYTRTHAYAQHQQPQQLGNSDNAAYSTHMCAKLHSTCTNTTEAPQAKGFPADCVMQGAGTAAGVNAWVTPAGGPAPNGFPEGAEELAGPGKP